MARQRRDERLLKEIAKRLRTIRHQRGLSQDTVLIDTDINVKRIEVGAINISMTTLALLCRYYAIPLEQFFKDIEADINTFKSID